jgi:hypothetical protein
VVSGLVRGSGGDWRTVRVMPEETSRPMDAMIARKSVCYGQSPASFLIVKASTAYQTRTCHSAVSARNGPDGREDGMCAHLFSLTCLCGVRPSHARTKSGTKKRTRKTIRIDYMCMNISGAERTERLSHTHVQLVEFRETHDGAHVDSFAAL